MRDRPLGVAFRTDGVPSEMFTSDTARMQAARVAELQEASADDAVPVQMSDGETTRIDATALTGLLEKSEGIALGTPKRGMPQLADEVVVVRLARGSSHGDLPVPLPLPLPPPPVDEEIEAAPVVEAPVLPAPRTSRLRDVLIGGALAIAAMTAWYAATQL